ncbi:hypothetical protein ACQUQU_17160 [Thalassolituus sp. LLYu03]|uniref:hypothetical protein n=1 Tax=Thalassolituus sp. LLYu03 TaxID=3421656 RepID=UPI003D267B77
MRVDKKTRLAGRIFSLVCTLVSVQMLMEGGYHYTSMGHGYQVSAASEPIRFMLALGWFVLLAGAGTYFGFIARSKE